MQNRRSSAANGLSVGDIIDTWLADISNRSPLGLETPVLHPADRVPNTVDRSHPLPPWSVVPRIRPARPYLDAWLRRLARELSGSGTLTQTAHRLSIDLGGTVDSWKSHLTSILEGREQPTIDLVTHLDALWSKNGSSTPEPGDQGLLF